MELVIEILRSTLSVSIPILLAALGGLMTLHANVFNISMEGMLLTGSFFAVLGSYFFESWIMGVLLGILSGVIMSLIFALFVLKIKAGEFITGIAINTFSVGLTTYLLRAIFKVKGTLISPKIVGIPKFDIPLLNKIPYLSDIFNGHSFIVYLSIIVIVPLINYIVFKTPFGLHLRGVGLNRNVMSSIGINPDKIKLKAILACGFLCGLGGAFLSLGYMTMFIENMSNGRGWTSLATVILTNGKPYAVMIVSLIFGLMEGIGFSLQTFNVPSQITSTLPYLSVLVALYINSRTVKNKVKIEKNE